MSLQTGNSQYKKCAVRILSQTDGKKSVFTAVGALLKTSSGAILRYSQNNGSIALETEGNTVRLQRKGDFYIRFHFCSGKQTQGDIGLSPQDKGKVDVYTERAEIFSLENGEGIKILLEYVLRFSVQEQRVSLQLIAKYKE